MKPPSEVRRAAIVVLSTGLLLAIGQAGAVESTDASLPFLVDPLGTTARVVESTDVPLGTMADVIGSMDASLLFPVDSIWTMPDAMHASNGEAVCSLDDETCIGGILCLSGQSSSSCLVDPLGLVNQGNPYVATASVSSDDGEVGINAVAEASCFYKYPGSGTTAYSCSSPTDVNDVDFHFVQWCQQPPGQVCEGMTGPTTGTTDLKNRKSSGWITAWCVAIHEGTGIASCNAVFGHDFLDFQGYSGHAAHGHGKFATCDGAQAHCVYGFFLDGSRGYT